MNTQSEYVFILYSFCIHEYVSIFKTYVEGSKRDFKSLRRYLLTLFATAFGQSTKLFERPIYHEHRDSMPLIW